MKIILQKVDFASCEVNNKIISKIDKGYLILLGISTDFKEEKLDWMVNKILNVRVFKSKEEPEKNFNLNIKDIKGEILIISQFTLFGDCTKKNKPEFIKSAKFNEAEKIYNKFIEKIKEKAPNLNIQTGEFGAMMKIKSQNNGPITLIIEK